MGPGLQSASFMQGLPQHSANLPEDPAVHANGVMNWTVCIASSMIAFVSLMLVQFSTLPGSAQRWLSGASVPTGGVKLEVTPNSTGTALGCGGPGGTSGGMGLGVIGSSR